MGEPRRVLWSIRSGLIPALLGVVSACGSSGPEEKVWTEDVQLPDGRVITVARKELTSAHSSWSGDASLLEQLGSTISFTGDLATLPSWQQRLMALVLYQDSATSEWVIVASTLDCDVWERSGKPRPPYWEFRLSDSGWRDVSLSRSSIGLKSNLIFVGRVQDNEHVSLDLRKSRGSGARGYRDIWGEPDQLFCGEGRVTP
jgi:hypothetical protein